MANHNEMQRVHISSMQLHWSHRSRTFMFVRLQGLFKSSISAAADHSASLVRITDQLGDLPFGVVHPHLVPIFSIIVLWVIGWHGTASRRFSVMRRLLPFPPNLILFFRAQHTGTKGEVGPFGD
uniref:Uncharacterized protein n=1 Tax=Solanum tuberosum TaxID=4113 RepID=M1DKM5_SOLTU